MKSIIALFDFDGTLTCGDSLLQFLRQVCGNSLFARVITLEAPVLAAFALRLITNDVAKESLLTRALRGITVEKLVKEGATFATQSIPDMLRKDTMKRLIEHQKQGHCCVLVSASLAVYLDPWAHENGFDHCLSTNLEVESNHRLSGKIDGENCYGPEKVRRIKLLFETIGVPSRIYAYGDTSGDLPMLGMADEGYLIRARRQRFNTLTNIQYIEMKK